MPRICHLRSNCEYHIGSRSHGEISKVHFAADTAVTLGAMAVGGTLGLLGEVVYQAGKVANQELERDMIPEDVCDKCVEQ